ncbi:MAG: class 3 adenylate cyclase/tetratricopeptide (TPR) repeat protein [Cryomorphaceae bacterium]|jgi:class 3 adenylate cyclase/tetratricopeptide (TPR) repeat protein
MKKYSACLLGLLFTICLLAQGSAVDSLKIMLEKPQADTSRVNTLLALAANYYRTAPEEANKIATEAKGLAQASDYQSGLAYSHKALGMSYYFQNNWVDALVEWELALKVFESMNDLNGVSNILNNLGAVHFNGGDDQAALRFYLQSLEVAEQNGDSLRIVTALINIASIYLTKDKTGDLAFDYYQRALPLSKKLEDKDAIGSCAVNMGEIYLRDTLNSETALQNIDSALYYFEMALDAFQNSATGNVAFALNSIGKVYFALGDYDEAIQYQTEAFQLAKSLDARLEMAQVLLSLANTYEEKGDIQEAIDAFTTSKDLAEEIGALYEIQTAYNGLADTYSKISDFRQAFENYKMSANLKDTLYNAEMDKKLQAQTLGYEIDRKQGQISLLEKNQELKDAELKRQKAIRNGTAVVGLLLLVLAGGLFNRYKYTTKTNRIIAAEKERSEGLLLNILPQETADELKEKGSATPKFYPLVSVLFTDFKGFTQIAEKLTPQELVEELNTCFISFDEIIEKHNLEKIKTIGDAYMCAGGIPASNENNPFDAVNAALEIRDFMEELRLERTAKGLDFWELRIGIHTGAVIAGVVGKNKFAYDIWGDAVNTASRMESSGIPGEVNISGATHEIVKDKFNCRYRGKVAAKNKGEVDMYLVESIKTEKVKSSVSV